MTPSEVRDYLLAEGYRALLEDGDGVSSTIQSGTDGTSFNIHFWHPTPFNGVLDEFHSMTFFTAFEVEEGDSSFELLNKSNAENRFVTAAFDEENTICYKMDVAASNETLTAELFDEVLGAWSVWLPRTIQETLK